MSNRITDKPPFFIVADSRSGFHLLVSLLRSTERIGHIGHDIENLPIEHTDNEILTLFEALREVNGIDGVYGTKVEIYWLSSVLRYFRSKEMSLNAAKWIRLHRRNIVRQSISMVNAAKKDLFVLSANASADKRRRSSELVDIPMAEVASNILKYNALNVFWQNFFDRHDIEPHTVVYERLASPLVQASEIRDTLQFLGVDDTGLESISTNYLKMSDDKQTEQIERQFIEEYTKFEVRYGDECAAKFKKDRST